MAKTFNLYGLQRYSTINVVYDLQKKQIIETLGCNTDVDMINVSEEYAFSTPTHISINGIPYFPSKYEAANIGTVVYSSIDPPRFNIIIANENFLNERAKVKRNTIGIKELSQYDLNGRKRHISQKKVMGESANEHAQRLIKTGVLQVDSLIAPSIQLTSLKTSILPLVNSS
ncbi:MAG TPA: hypothetical protein VNX01_12545, partial [Bacteroidia bacterium]|nr:hypothetical protein [Bacteroidia bacterium]